MKKVQKQIGFMNEEQLKTWRNNPADLDVAIRRKPGAISTEEAVHHVHSLLQEKITINPDATTTIPNFLDTNDKDLQRYLRTTYGLATDKMLAACISTLLNMSSVNEIKKGLSKIKSIYGFLKLDQDFKGTLEKATKSLSVQIDEPIAIVFTTIIDDPKILLSMGSLVNTSSCHNFRNGNQIETVLGYVVDANTKALASFAIGPGNQLDYKDFPLLADAIRNNHGAVKFEFDSTSKQLKIIFNKKEYNIQLDNAYLRQIIKVGQTPTGSLGVRAEPLVIQSHPAIEFIKTHAEAIFNEYSQQLQAETDTSILIAQTRNHLGTYSDSSGGVKKDDYQIT